MSSRQFKSTTSLYLKKSHWWGRERILYENLVACSLKSQFSLSRKLTVWIESLVPGYSCERICNFCPEVGQNRLLKVRLKTTSMWTCRFPIVCTQSWYMKGKQMLVTTGPSYTTSLEKAGSNTTTSQWQSHRGRNWREIHSAAWRTPVPTAWCT